MDADLVAAWRGLCQLLSPAFTRPTFVTFLHVATGWVLCRSRPAVTGLVLAVGSKLLGHAAKHWTSYERFFCRAAWSPLCLSRLLLTRVVVPLADAEGEGGVGGPVDLNIDDTTCGRYGGHVAFAGYFKDSSACNVLKKVCHWSHNWVLGCVTFRPRRWPGWVVALPVLWSLYHKRGDCDRRHPFRSRHELAAGMLAEARGALRAALPGRTIRVVTDGQYATRVLCGALDRERGESLVSRIRRDAALYDLPPKRRPPSRRHKGKAGAPRKKGRRLPTPRAMAARRTKGWLRASVRAYGKDVEKLVLPVVCLWPRVCGHQPIKLLIVRDPAGRQKDDFFFCTDPRVSDVGVIERMASRWTVEEVVRDAKQHGGMEKVQGWCPRTVERQVPLCLAVQTVVKAWYVRHAAGPEARWARPRGGAACGWMRRQKSHPSYLDMLATLRHALWDQRLGIKCNSTPRGRVCGLWKTLQFTLCAAA